MEFLSKHWGINKVEPTKGVSTSSSTSNWGWSGYRAPYRSRADSLFDEYDSQMGGRSMTGQTMKAVRMEDYRAPGKRTATIFPGQAADSIWGA